MYFLHRLHLSAKEELWYFWECGYVRGSCWQTVHYYSCMCLSPSPLTISQCCCPRTCRPMTMMVKFSGWLLSFRRCELVECKPVFDDKLPTCVSDLFFVCCYSQLCSIVKHCSWTCHARKCVRSSPVEPWAGRPQGPHGCGDALQGVGPLSIVVTAALGYLAWELHQSLGEESAHNTWPQGVEQERMWRVPWIIFFNLKIKRNFWFIRIDSNSIPRFIRTAKNVEAEPWHLNVAAAYLRSFVDSSSKLAHFYFCLAFLACKLLKLFSHESTIHWRFCWACGASGKDNNQQQNFPAAVMPVFFFNHVLDEKIPSPEGWLCQILLFFEVFVWSFKDGQGCFGEFLVISNSFSKISQPTSQGGGNLPQALCVWFRQLGSRLHNGCSMQQTRSGFEIVPELLLLLCVAMLCLFLLQWKRIVLMLGMGVMVVMKDQCFQEAGVMVVMKDQCFQQAVAWDVPSADLQLLAASNVRTHATLLVGRVVAKLSPRLSQRLRPKVVGVAVDVAGQTQLLDFFFYVGELDDVKSWFWKWPMGH